jgi:hypothetical protein
MRFRPQTHNPATKADPSSLSAMAEEPMTGVAGTQLSFFLLGATGHRGLPFLSQALARGHFVTIFVRNMSKLPATVASHPHLRFHGRVARGRQGGAGDEGGETGCGVRHAGIGNCTIHVCFHGRAQRAVGLAGVEGWRHNRN